MNVLWSIIGFLLTIGILVMVHEGGHCWMAKRLGVKVTRFSFGMGRVLWRRRWGETEYCLSLLPIGGYVQMAEESEMNEREIARAYSRQARWKKALIIFAGPAVNFIVALLLYVMIGGIGTPDYAPVVDRPYADTQAKTEGVEQGDRVVKVGSVPVRGFMDLSFELMNRMGDADVSITFEREGVPYVRHFTLANYTIDTMREGLLNIGFYPMRKDPVIDFVVPGSPAEKAGLQKGDRIYEVDGVETHSQTDVVAEIRHAKARHPMTMVVAAKDAARRTVTAIPDDKNGHAAIGINIRAMPEMVTVRLGPWEALKSGLLKVERLTTLQAKSVSQMATGEVSTKNLAGPVGIADMAGSAVKSGFVPFLEFLALISVALGFMNLLPVPVLDGGQLVILALEGLRGQDFTVKTRQLIAKAGVLMMLMLFGLVMMNDLTRIAG